MGAHHGGNNGTKREMHRRVKKNSPIKSDSAAALTNDTIAAISTPAGEGAIALVRISGPEAVRIADKVFRGMDLPSKFATHVQYLGEIHSGSGERVDQVMIVIHRSPASYTGEDVVEISCHGGMLVTAKVLEACLVAGGRAARP